MNYPSPDQILDMRTNCVATNLRRATRFVNRIYEEEFRGYEITAVQFAIFALLGMREEMSGSTLANELNADISTVTRNMETLESKSLVEKKSGSDRRVRVYSLSVKGRKVLRNGITRWEAAQNKIMAIMGRESWEPLRETLKRLDDGATENRP